MTDEQIIKAFEICYINEEDGCESCPLRDEEGFCTDVVDSTLLYDVLDLINRQKEEIERLKKAIKVQDIMIEQQDYKLKTAKAKAVKEFWDKAKQTREFRTCPYVYITDGNDLVKDMTEPVKLEHNSLCETETYMGE